MRSDDCIKRSNLIVSIKSLSSCKQTKDGWYIGDLLDFLPYAVEAPFNTYQRQHDLICLPDTRIDASFEIYTIGLIAGWALHLLAKRLGRHGEVDDCAHRGP